MVFQEASKKFEGSSKSVSRVFVGRLRVFRGIFQWFSRLFERTPGKFQSNVKGVSRFSPESF